MSEVYVLELEIQYSPSRPFPSLEAQDLRLVRFATGLRMCCQKSAFVVRHLRLVPG